MIEAWIDFIRQSPARHRATFLSDYDMLTTEHLVQGVDVWLNTPRRPWEACGTSGMKVLVNGGINISELDGWWAEAYEPAVGWALGDGLEHDDDPEQDAREAEALYRLLEEEVLPEFYNRDDDGIPTSWVARMRRSMAQLTPQFSTNRSVREYTEDYYLPAAAAFVERSGNKGKAGQALAGWQQRLEDDWHQLSFGKVNVDTQDGQHQFEVSVQLGSLSADDVQVQLYAQATDDNDAVCLAMTCQGQHAGDTDSVTYTLQFAAERPASHYTPRIVPHFKGANIPTEAPYILWQH